MPEDIKVVNLGGTIANFPRTPIVPDLPSQFNGVAGGGASFDALFAKGLGSVKFKGKENIPVSSFYTGNRYTESRPFTDVEEMAAAQQSAASRWANGLTKMAGTAATSFVSGTAGLIYGIGASIADKRFASLIDNDVTRVMDRASTSLEDIMPNYYSKAESDAEWYSGTNLLSANFWSDKVVKNLGYALGALGGGVAWNKAFKLLGVTDGLVKAGAGMEAAASVEQAMAAAPRLQKLTAFESALGNLSRKYVQAPVASAFKNSDRILTSVMATFGEASIEGLHNMNAFRNKAIEEFKSVHGRLPVGAELDEINQYADKVATYTWGMNTLLLSATNYIQLPKILGSSRKGEKMLINQIDQEGLGGMFVKNVPKTVFGKLATRAKGVSAYLFSPTEAFEEGAQFAIQVGTGDFFERAYKNKEDLGGFLNTLNNVMGRIVNDGIEETLGSKEGMESILIGGISGGMQQSVQTYKRQGIFGQGGQKAINTEIALRSLNQTNLKNVLEDQAKFLSIGIGSQKLRQRAIASGDILSEKDFEKDYTLSYVMPRVKYGKVDSIYNELAQYESQATTEEGFGQLQSTGIANMNESREQFLARIAALKETAKSVEKLYSTLNDKYANVVIDGERKYNDSTIDKLVYAVSKVQDYDARIPQLNVSLASAGVNVLPVVESISKEGIPNREAVKDAVSYINDLDTTSDVKNDLKRDLTDIIELSLRRKQFIKEYDAIVENPSDFEIDEDFEFGNNEPIVGTVADEEGKPVEKEIQIGQAYNLKQPLMREGNKLMVSPKISVLSQSLGEEYEVLLPNGKEMFLTKEELKSFELSDEAVDSEVEQVMDDAIDAVLSRDKYQDIPKPTENKLAAINSLNSTELIDDVEQEFNERIQKYKEEKAERKKQQEELIKSKAELEKQQSQVENKSATIATPPPPTPEELEALAATQGKLKSVSKLFISGTTPTETAEEPIHIRNSREFLNNAKNFNNRGNLAAILVTQNQEVALGLSGLTALSYGTSDASDATDVENGLVAQVFVEQDAGKTFFVNKNGERIGEVGQPVDIQQVIFQTMPTTSLYDRSGKPRFRADQMAEAEAASKAWGAKRAELFSSAAFPLKAYRFSISRGIPVENIINGRYERNQVGGILIPENKIATQQGLLQIVTKGSVVHNGENITFKNGLTIFQYADTLQIVNNNPLGNGKANAVYLAIKTMMDKFQQTKKLDVNLTTYIQNVLFWKKTPETFGNQIFIDTNTGQVFLGGNSYTLSELETKKTEIVNKLKETFHAINNTTLRDNFYDKFYEYKVEDGNLVEQEWPNYQSYLLSSKGRSADQTPLVTNVAKPTPAVPYSFKQKYATLVDFELPVIQAPAPVAAPKAPVVPGAPAIGEFNLDGQTVNTFKGFKSGDVNFKGTLVDGNITINYDDIIENETVVKIASDGKLVNETIVPALKAGNIFDPSADDVELVKTFLANKLVIELGKLQEVAPAAAPAPVAPAPTPAAPVVDVRADIERRRNEELQQLDKLKDGDEVTYFKEDGGFTKGIVTDFKNGEFNLSYTNENEDLKSPGSGGIYNTTFVKAAINAKYDAELAALEGAKPTEAAPIIEKKYNPEDTTLPDDEYMRVGVKGAGIETLDDAQIELFKAWAAEKVPTIPFEVLDNLVNTYDNEKAWGVFEKGVAKFYKGAPGTAPYHEVFEGIWKGFLTPEQRQLLLNEFRSKSGEFTDRASGRKIAYENATDQQAKERIADDFGEFRVGKLPARTLGEKILKFFRNIIEFFKSFVQKPSMKDELFKAIEAGKFKDMTLPASVAESTPEYMRIPGLTETQAYEFVQDMTARAAQYIFGDSKKTLYDLKEITGAEIFSKIKDAYTKENKYQTLGDERYNRLVTRTKEKLRTLGINFSEEDTIDINDESITSRDYAPEPFSTDWKRTSPFAIKFVTATLPEVEPTNQKNASSLSLPKRIFSSIKGYKLVSFGRVFNTLIDKLSNTSSVDNLNDKLSDLAKFDATYVRFFQRVGGDLSTGTIDFSNFKNEDWRLFINFFQTFTKQKPDAVIQYIDGTSVYTAPANQFTASKLLQSEWFENIKMLADDPKSIIKRNKLEKTFDVDKSKLPPSVPKEPQAMVDFLTNLGIGFPLSTYTSLKDSQKKSFADAVGGIYTYIQKTPSIGSIMGKTLGINSQLSELANLYIKVTNPSQDSTYFGVENQRIQSYADNNVPSVMENEFNSVETVDELKQLRPELNDVFSANSIILKDGGNFYNTEGKRYKLLKIGYIQGTKEIDEDKGTTTSKLTLSNRFTQEINENLNGNYYILVPADSSTQWQMNLGNHMIFADVVGGRAWTKINSIFRGYLTDEIALALDADNRKQIRNVGDKAKQLRFFREILSEKDVTNIETLIAEDKTQEEIERYVDENIDRINTSIADFINSTVAETRDILTKNYEITQVKEGEFVYKNLQDGFASKNDINKFKMSSDDVNNLLTFANANYIINNIELHKIVFGDPYEFKVKNGKLDETKRIKSFLSPRRITFDSDAYNAFLNTEYNKVGDITLTPEDPGYHLHKSFTNTVTLSDIELSSNLYPKINEADAASIIMDNTYREVKLKNGQWPTEAEAWHQWQMAYTRNKLAAKGLYTYTNESLQKADSELISKPEPVFVTDVLKPIVSGVKAGETKIDNVLDKFSQMPLYYKAVEGRALENIYLKMWKENIGYAVFESGRKVGATKLNKLYNEDGTLNENPFDGIVKVAWKSYGIQVETAFENPKDQTRGSQLTKLSSLDLFENGQASPQAKAAYERNLKALDMLHENGYKNLLNRLGLEDLGDGFRLVDPAAIQESLEYELLRREMAENAKDTIKLDENGQFPIPFEASPAYKQIKDILFSMVNKALASPKMNGGPKVQVPVTGWEDAKAGRGLAIKTDKGYRKISKEEYNKLSEEQKKKVVLTSDTLKFYTKEDPYMEVLLPHWFRGKFSKKKFPNDEAILNYLNNTEEGKSILTGIGFRIPTQAMSSIEVFRVKGFLPQSMGDTIVVPSEITAKAGSDFDIDKLNTYLKSTYIDKNGNIRLVKYQGSEEATKEFFGKVFDETLEKKKVNKAELLEATQILSLGLEDPNNLVEKYSNLLDVLLEDVEDSSDFENKIVQELERLGDVNLQEKLRGRFVNDMYTRSLQNEYYEALEEMITLPENFDRLVAPISDAGLSKVAEELDKLRGEDETTIPGRLLNRNYLTILRNAFVTAKKWVGIAAVNITGHSLAQKANIYINPAKFEALSNFDRKILGDGNIQLPHNTVEVGGQEYVSISGRLTADGKQYISDRLSGYGTSFVDVANDPYIMKIIGSGSDTIVGVFMFLERIGAGENTVWFLNQPIIREYLKFLDAIGKKGLFSKMDNDYIRSFFPTSSEVDAFDSNSLKENIRKYYAGEFNEDDNAVQQIIFTEFLKYAKMAEYSFKLTQATNYDTTKFRNSDEFNRKQARTQTARNKNIFSSVDDILNSSFIGKQARLIDSAMSSLGEVIKTEKDDFTIIINDVIDPFLQNEYMSADEFNRVAGKAKASFLDYIIQTQSTLNTEIEKLVVSNESVADQLAQAKKRHPEMKLLNELQVVSSDRLGGAKSIRLRANLKDAFDTDMYTDMMRELKVVEPELFNGLLKIALLQGTYQSSISIRNIMPIEDLSPLIKPVIDSLSSTEQVKNFSKGAFYRNNWKDNTIVPTVQPKFFVATYKDPVSGERIEMDPYEDAVTGELIYRYNSPSFPAIEITKDLILELTDRKVLLLSEIYNSDAVKYDFVKVPRVVVDRKTGEKIDMETGLSVTNATFARKKVAGDLSLKDVYGYQKVKYANGEPVVTARGEHVYKLVNLYGDGQLVSEYYLDSKPSVINNGTVRIDNEISDADLIKFFGNQEVVVPSPVMTPSEAPAAPATTLEVEYTPENITSLQPNEVFVFGSNTEGRHGAGAAKTAMDKFGAKYGQAEGLQGQSYGIITKDLAKGKRSVSLEDIKSSLADLLIYAKNNPSKKFYVTKLGTELAGYKVGEIAQLFKELQFEYSWGVPKNVILPREFEVRTGAAEAPVIDPNTKINIYAGTGENADLSNFAIRPFEISGYKFNSVEQAFQEAKYEFTKRTAEDSQIRTNIQNTSSAATIKKLGSKYPTLDTKAWDSKSSDIMKRVIKLSFEQNPAALERLLATGNATLTHTQDKTKWGKEFPRLLMEVREELRGGRVVSFEQSFPAERQEEILNNFASKHNMTKEAARQYINDAIASKGQEVIDKLNECY